MYGGGRGSGQGLALATLGGVMVLLMISFSNYREIDRIDELEVKRPLGRTVTYHDPCHNARYMGVVDEPRQLLRHIGATVIDMANSGVHTTCCGGGGGVQASDSELTMEVSKARVRDAVETGAEILSTDCPTCFSNLKDAARELGNPIQVTLIWDLLLKALR